MPIRRTTRETSHRVSAVGLAGLLLAGPPRSGTNRPGKIPVDRLIKNLETKLRGKEDIPRAQSRAST
jgi:hypothetical protein